MVAMPTAWVAGAGARCARRQGDGGGMGESATLEELTNALDDTLRANGVAAQIKARLRAEVFQVLEGGNQALVEPAPCPSNETMLVNELIKEFMAFNGYKHALSVFELESGQPKENKLPRRLLAKELNLDLGLPNAETRGKDGARKEIPLLYLVLQAMRELESD